MPRKTIEPFAAIRSAPSLSKGQRAPEFKAVQNFLQHFGYVRGSTPDTGRLDDATARALTLYQKRQGLVPTGMFDDETREQMTTHRCGMPDLDSGLAFSTRCAWPRRNLTFAFEDGTNDVGGTAEFQAVRNAFATWAAAAPLTFAEVTTAQNPDIVIDWRPANDPDHSMVGGVLAHADFPPGCSIITNNLPKPVHFDDSEHLWTIGAVVDGFDIETVALHEIGHILGLQHSDVTGAVMFPTVSSNSTLRVLTDDDLGGIRTLYPGGWSLDWFPLPGNHVFDREKQQVAAVSRAPGNLDLFVLGFDNHAYSTFWSDTTGWSPDWFPIPGNHVFDRDKQQIAAVSRTPGNLDLFVIGFDNHVYSTFWSDATGWNAEWFRIPGNHVFDHEKQRIAAVSRAPGNLDLFVIGFDNHIYSTFWNGAGWNAEWFRVPGNHVFDRDKQQVAAVSRAPGNLDLFVLGFDNHAYSTFWSDATGWNPEWFPLPGNHVFDHEKQQIAAVSRAPGNLDLFVLGFDNHAYSTFWNGAAGWSPDWFPLPGNHVFDHEKQRIAAVSRAPENLDLFVLGLDNHAYSSFWSGATGWASDWFRIPGNHVFDRDKQQIAAVARTSGNLDLFVLGFDNRGYSTFWH